jgi:predicted thioesterase
VKILIATPVHDDMVTTRYMMSVQKMIGHLHGRVQFVQLFIGASLVTRARNAYASLILQDPSYTHLLFIDSDMGFRAEAVERMLATGKDFVGCVTPKRAINFARVHSISRQIADQPTAQMVGQEYVATEGIVETTLDDGRTCVVTEHGFAHTSHTGSGLTLIKRTVLEQMRAAYPQLAAKTDQTYLGLGVREEVFQPFEPFQREDGLFYSEDLAFCRRWTDGCGGQVWTCVDETITHVGRVAFPGKYIDRMRYSDLK